MVAYFITLIMLDTLTVPNEDDFQIAEDIREGRINALLLKPLDYRLYRFHLYGAARLVHAAFAVVPLALAMIWLGHYYHGLPWLVNLPLALAATFGAALIQFFFCFTLAMIAFWILDIGSVTFIIYSVEFLLGGHIFPIDAMPALAAAACASDLPFAYETFFPAAILIGHVHGNALATGFAWQWAGSASSTSSAGCFGNAACASTRRWGDEAKVFERLAIVGVNDELEQDASRRSFWKLSEIGSVAQVILKYPRRKRLLCELSLDIANDV